MLLNVTELVACVEVKGNCFPFRPDIVSSIIYLCIIYAIIFSTRFIVINMIAFYVIFILLFNVRNM